MSALLCDRCGRRLPRATESACAGCGRRLCARCIETGCCAAADAPVPAAVDLRDPLSALALDREGDARVARCGRVPRRRLDALLAVLAAGGGA